MPDDLKLQAQARVLAPYLRTLVFTPFFDEDTWNPNLVGTGTAGTFTYTLRSGTYTRLGTRVLFEGRINISAITVAPTGNLTITGLPFSSTSPGSGIPGVANFTDFTGVTFGAGYTTLGGRVNTGATTIALTESGSNKQAIFLPAAALVLVGGVAEFVFGGHYQTA
jgi:hypothetical protein